MSLRVLTPSASPRTMPLPEELVGRLLPIRMIVFDIDGVMTDGRLIYTGDGVEVKEFHVHDGLGLALAGDARLRIAFITGRQSTLVERRAKELQVGDVFLNCSDKLTAMKQLAEKYGLGPEEMLFMGDDLIDLPPMRWVGCAVAPANAVDDAKQCAHWVTGASGGNGAVREVVDALLIAQGTYDVAVERYLERQGGAKQ